MTTAKSRSERFTDVARHEVTTKQLRLPIWNQAMIAAAGDVKTAEETYVMLRVQQMEVDEEQQEQSRTARIARDHAEELKPKTHLSKTLLLVFLAILFFAAFAILYFVRWK
jgi:hypothetical protein